MLDIHNAQVTYTNITLKSGGELQKLSEVFNSQQHIDLCENTRGWSGKAFPHFIRFKKYIEKKHSAIEASPSAPGNLTRCTTCEVRQEELCCGFFFISKINSTVSTGFQDCYVTLNTTLTDSSYSIYTAKYTRAHPYMSSSGTSSEQRWREKAANLLQTLST